MEQIFSVLRIRMKALARFLKLDLVIAICWNGKLVVASLANRGRILKRLLLIGKIAVKF